MEKKRYKELLEGFENNGTIPSPEREDSTNLGKLNEERNRYRKQFSENVNENFYSVASSKPTFAGATVNSIVDDTTNFGKSYNANKLTLLPQEALEVSIRRALKSGAPLNNIGFYEEVNRNLELFGFPGKNAVDIKAALTEMMGDNL